MYLSLPWVACGTMIFISGWVADELIERNILTTINVRRVCLIVGMLILITSNSLDHWVSALSSLETRTMFYSVSFLHPTTVLCLLISTTVIKISTIFIRSKSSFSLFPPPPSRVSHFTIYQRLQFSLEVAVGLVIGDCNKQIFIVCLRFPKALQPLQ